jgi:3-phytase
MTERLIDRVRDFGVPATYDEATETCLVTGADPGQGGQHLTADAEGLTLAQRRDGSGYLFASSQGDSTFAVYDLRSSRYLAGFAVADSPVTDGVQNSDGATLTTQPVGAAFPHGLLVVHDGDNTPETKDAEGETRTDTNFKLVPLERVTRPLGLRL